MSGGGFRGRGPALRGRRGMAGGVGGLHNPRPNFNQQRRDGHGPMRNYWNDRSLPPWRQMNGMPPPQRPQFPIYESHHYRGQPQFCPGPGHRGRGNNQRMLGDRGMRRGMPPHPPGFSGMGMIRSRPPEPTRFPPLGSEEERQQKIAETADKLKQKLSTLTVSSSTGVNFWEDDFESAGFSKTNEEDDTILNKGIPELRHEPPELNLTVKDLKDIGRVDPDSSINSYEHAERSAYREEDGLTIGDRGREPEPFDSNTSSEYFVNDKSTARYCGDIGTEGPTDVRKESTIQNEQMGCGFDQVDFAHLDHSQSRGRDTSSPKAMEDTTRFQNEKDLEQQQKASQIHHEPHSVAKEQPDQLKKVREKLREVIENEQRGEGGRGRRFESERNIGQQTDTRMGFQLDIGPRLQSEIGSDFHPGSRPTLQRFQSPPRFRPPFRPEHETQSNFRPAVQPTRFDQPNFSMGPRFQRPQMMHSEFSNRPAPRMGSGDRDIRMGFDPSGPPPGFNAGPFFNRSELPPKFMIPGGQNSQQPPLGFFPAGPISGFVGQDKEPPFGSGIVSSPPVSDFSQIGYTQISHIHMTQGPGYIPVVNGSFNPVIPLTNTASGIIPQFPVSAVPSTSASNSPDEPRVVINPMPIAIEALDIQPPPPPPSPPKEKRETCQLTEEKLLKPAEDQQIRQNPTSNMNDELEDMQEALEFAKQFMNMNTDAEEKEERNEEGEKTQKTQEDSGKSDGPMLVELPPTISQVQPPPPREPVTSEKQESKESKTKNIETSSKQVRQEIVLNKYAGNESLVLDNKSLMNELPRPKVAFNVNSTIKKITQIEEWKTQQVEPIVQSSSSQSRRLKLSESSTSPLAVRDESKGTKKECVLILNPVDDRRDVKDREQRDNQKNKRRHREEGRRGERKSSSRNSSRNSSTSPSTVSADGFRDSSPSQLVRTKSAHQSSPKETANDRVDAASLKIRASTSKTSGNSLLASTVDANWKDKVINQFLKMSKNDICNMVNSSGLRKFDIAMKRLVKERKYSLSQERRSSADDAVKGYDMSREEFMSQLSAMLDPSATVDVKNLPAKFIQHLSEVLKLDVESHLNDGAELTVENDNPLDGLDSAEVNRENENEGNNLLDNHPETPSFEQFLGSDVNPGPDYSTDDTFALSTKSELCSNPETHVTTDIGHMLTDSHDSGSNPANDDSLPNMAAIDDIFSAGIAKAKLGQKSANRITEENSLDEADMDFSSKGGFLRARNLRTMQASLPHVLINDIFTLKPDDSLPVSLQDTFQTSIESGAEGWNRKKRQNPDTFRNLTKEEWEARCAEKDIASSSKTSSPRGTGSPRALSLKSNRSTRNQSPPTPVRETSTRSSSATQGRQTDSNDSEDSSSGWSSDSSDSEHSLHGTPNVSKLLRVIKEREKRAKNRSLNETIRDEVNSEIEREKYKDRERQRERRMRKREKSKRKRERKGKKKKRKHKKRNIEKHEQTEEELIVPKVEVSSMDVIIKEEPEFEEQETVSKKFNSTEKDHPVMNKLSRSAPEEQTHVQHQNAIPKRLDSGLNSQKAPSRQKSVTCPMTQKSTGEVKANKAPPPSVPNVNVTPSPDVDTVKKALTPAVNIVKLTRAPAIDSVKKAPLPTVKLTPLPAVDTVKKALLPANNAVKISPSPALVTVKKAPPTAVNVVKLARSSAVDTVKKAPLSAINAVKVTPVPAVATIKEASPSSVGIAKEAALPVVDVTHKAPVCVADNGKEAPKVLSTLEKLRKNTESGSWPSLPEIPLVNVRLVDIKHTVNQLKKSGAKKINIQAYKARKLQGDTEKQEKANEVETCPAPPADDSPSCPKSSGELVCDVKTNEKVDGLKGPRIKTQDDGTEKNSTNIVKSELTESQAAHAQGPLRRRILRRGTCCAEKLGVEKMATEKTKQKKKAEATEQKKNQKTMEEQQVNDENEKEIDRKDSKNDSRDREASLSNEERCKKMKESEDKLRSHLVQEKRCDSPKPQDKFPSSSAQQKNNFIIESSNAELDKLSTKKINEKSDVQFSKDQKDLSETKQVGKRLVRRRSRASSEQRNPVIILEKITTEQKKENIEHLKMTEAPAKHAEVPAVSETGEKLQVPEVATGESGSLSSDKQLTRIESRASSEQLSPVIILDNIATEQKKENIEHLEMTKNLAKDAGTPTVSETGEKLLLPEVVAGKRENPTPDKQLERVEHRVSSEQHSSMFILDKMTTEQNGAENIKHLEIIENVEALVTKVTEGSAAHQVIAPEIAEPIPEEQFARIEPRVENDRHSPVLILDKIVTEQEQEENIKHIETTENLEKKAETPAVHEEAEILEVPKVVVDGGAKLIPENIETVMSVTDPLPQVETEADEAVVCEEQVLTEVETRSVDDTKNDLQTENLRESIEKDLSITEDPVIQNVATSTAAVEREMRISTESNVTDEAEHVIDATDNVIDLPETQEELLRHEAEKIMLVSNQLDGDELDPTESRDSDVRTVVNDLIQEVVSRLEILSDETETETIIATSSMVEIAAELSELSEYGALDLKSPEPPESPLKGFSEDSINSSLLGKRKLVQSVLEITEDFISSKRCKDIDEIMLSMIRESGSCTEVIVSSDSGELGDSALKINEGVELGSTIEEENQHMSDAAIAHGNGEICQGPGTPSGDTLSLGSSIDLDNSEFIVLSEILSDDNFPREENEFDETEPEGQKQGGKINCSEDMSGKVVKEHVEAQENTEVLRKSLKEKEELEAILWDLTESSHPAIVKDLSPSIELEITSSREICDTQQPADKCNQTPSVEQIFESNEPVEDLVKDKDAGEVLNCDSHSKIIQNTENDECIRGNDSATPEVSDDKITKMDKNVLSSENTSSSKHLHGVKRRHGMKHKKQKKLAVIGEKKIRDMLKEEELVTIVKKVQTKESVMARMVEIDLEVHKLMSEKMKLYEMLKSGDLPVEQSSASTKGFAEPLLDNTSTSHRKSDTHTGRKECSRTPDRQESTSKARTESPQPRSETCTGKRECSRNSRECESSSKTRSVSPHAKSAKSVVSSAAKDDTSRRDDSETITVFKKKKKKKKRNQEKRERLTRHSGITADNECKSSRVRKELPDKQVDSKTLITKGKGDKKSNSSHSSKHNEVKNLNLSLRSEERESKSVEFTKTMEKNPVAEVQSAAGQRSRRSQHNRESRRKADRAAGLKDDQSKKKEQLQEASHETKLRSRTICESLNSAVEKQDSSQVSEAMVSKGSRKSFSVPPPAKKPEKREKTVTRVRRRVIFTKGRKGRLKRAPKPREYSPNVLSASEDEIPLNLLYVKISPKKHRNSSNIVRSTSTKLPDTKSNPVIDHLQEAIDAVAEGKIDEYQQSGKSNVVEVPKTTATKVDVPKVIHQVLPDASIQCEVHPLAADRPSCDETSVQNNCEEEPRKLQSLNEIETAIGAIARKLQTPILQSDNNSPTARVLEISLKNSGGIDVIETNQCRGNTVGSKGGVNQFLPSEQSCNESGVAIASLNPMVDIPDFVKDESRIMPPDPDLGSNFICRNLGIEKDLDNLDFMLETVSCNVEKEVEVSSSAVTRGKRKRMASTDRGPGGNALPKKRSAITRLEMMSCYVCLTDCNKYTDLKKSLLKTGSRRSSRISNAGSDRSVEQTPQQKLNTAGPFCIESAMECDVRTAKSNSPFSLQPTSSAEPTAATECPDKSLARHRQPIDGEIDIGEMERHSQCDNEELSVIEIQRSTMTEGGSRPASTPLKLAANVARRYNPTYFNSSGRSSVVLEKSTQEQQSKLRPRSKSVINIADLRADWDEPSLEETDSTIEQTSAPVKEKPDTGLNQDEIQIVRETGNERTENEVQEVELPRIQYSVHKGPILEVKVFGDSILAASEDGVIYRYSQTCNGILNTYEGHRAAVTCMYVLGVGGMEIVRDWLFSGSLDGSLRCFDIKTSVQIRGAADVRSPIQCMDQAWGVIYLGTKSGYVFRFNIKSHTFKSDEIKFSEEAVLALKATTEGPRRVLIAASRSQPITIRDALSGLFLRTISGNRSYTVYSLMMESNLVYCGTSSTALPVFDFINGSQVELYNAGPGIVCMRMYKRLLFAGCYDGNIYVFDTKERRLVCSIPGPGNMLLSMDIVKNKIVAGSKDRRLHMWQMPDQVQAILATRT
ncbi:uncharacterized protein LOC107218279 [Neodiprion lecontei]|uniref:Uncharacterized protein LOC107218279 n=1 Tax=Neodiprion lecontei TaxID=441921 RepID=A0A6J0BD16_NEOLC|nr:uncharacterized protein LOC107218279 [Neodiprion lecontei]XP_046600682.1 uncharacterized protein LOC107218279 [Neodiprion lecontei]XP_046600683.1 uncharacterized protein LOC107218279 [Neodiprion lecontei]